MGTPDVSKIHLGPGEIFFTSDLTAAPPGGVDLLDPTTSSLMAMTTGFVKPAETASPDWRYGGYTNGPATLTYRPTFYMVQTEQTFAEVITTPTAEEATLAFVLLETDYRNLALGLAMATTEVNAGAPVNNAIFVGSKPAVNLNVVVLSSRKRSGAGYWVVTLYQGYSSEGVALPFQRRAETRIPVTLRTLADGTRPEGDQLFQLVEYAANPA